MKTIYLDQNKWIELARAFHGKDSEHRLNNALAFLRDASQTGRIALPLSAVHYIETARIHNQARRTRLGVVMWELSRGYTLASYHHIVCHELEEAFARRFLSLFPRPLEVLSRGVAHAFGIDYPGYRLPEPDRSALPEALVEGLEKEGQAIMEKAVITGDGPGGITMPPFGYTSNNKSFKDHLDNMHPKLSQGPLVQWDDVLHAMELVDILNPLNEVMTLHGLDRRTLELFGKEWWTSLLQELPSRQIDLQLHRQVIKNPQLMARITDLEDWSGLGLAVAYCDVVVCEKHFADLVLRDDFVPKAQIITDVRRLPDMNL